MFPHCTVTHVTSFPPAALPAFTGTTTLSDSLYPVSPFFLCYQLAGDTHILVRGYRASRVATHSHCTTCHGLGPRGGDHGLAIDARAVLTSVFSTTSSLPLKTFRGSIPSVLRFTACRLAVLRLISGVTPVDPRTRYPAVANLPGRDSHPLECATLPGRTEK